MTRPCKGKNGSVILFPEGYSCAIAGFFCGFIATGGYGNIQDACAYCIKVDDLIVIFTRT